MSPNGMKAALMTFSSTSSDSPPSKDQFLKKRYENVYFYHLRLPTYTITSFASLMNYE